MCHKCVLNGGNARETKQNGRMGFHLVMAVRTLLYAQEPCTIKVEVRKHNDLLFK